MTATASANAGIDHFVKMAKLEAVIDFLIASNTLGTYKNVAKACGWHHRDQKFHVALDEISRASMKSIGAAKTAVVCMAGNGGRPVLPGHGFFLMLENHGIDIQGSDSETWNKQLIKLGMTARDPHPVTVTP